MRAEGSAGMIVAGLEPLRTNALLAAFRRLARDARVDREEPDPTLLERENC